MSDEITDSYGGAVDGDAIPAESQPAGFQAIPAWGSTNPTCENVNMAATMKTHLEIFTKTKDAAWVHSFFLSAPFMVVHKLYDDMCEKTKGH